MERKRRKKDDLITEMAYNKSSLIHKMMNRREITMNDSVLTNFFSKLPDFYKYAPKEVLQAFCDEFITEFAVILKDYDEEKMLNLLEEWFDTVDVYSNAEVSERLQNIDSDIVKGVYSEWDSKENIG